MVSGWSPTVDVLLFYLKIFSWYGANRECLLYSLNPLKRGFSSSNEAVVLPNYIKSCMARYELCSVCSIREYFDLMLLKLTRLA